MVAKTPKKEPRTAQRSEKKMVGAKVTPVKKTVPVKKTAAVKKAAPVKQATTVKKAALIKQAPTVKKVVPIKQATTIKNDKTPESSNETTTIKKTIGSKKKKVEVQSDVLELSPATTAQTMLSYGVESYRLKPNEEYMNEGQRLHFEKLLNAWLDALLQGGDATISDLQESSEVPADLSDQASKEEEFALKLRKRDRERKLIKKIEESLQQLKTLDFGYCEECGVEIGIRRLEARPTATLCIDCKTIAEIKEKQQRT
jgi:DnaK suppressor protein